ncbi:MAG: LodA/GoxA family CTQ-dependent oxidase [Amaricoccus sp.]
MTTGDGANGCQKPILEESVLLRRKAKWCREGSDAVRAGIRARPTRIPKASGLRRTELATRIPAGSPSVRLHRAHLPGNRTFAPSRCQLRTDSRRRAGDLDREQRLPDDLVRSPLEDSNCWWLPSKRKLQNRSVGRSSAIRFRAQPARPKGARTASLYRARLHSEPGVVKRCSGHSSFWCCCYCLLRSRSDHDRFSSSGRHSALDLRRSKRAPRDRQKVPKEDVVTDLLSRRDFVAGLGTVVGTMAAGRVFARSVLASELKLVVRAAVHPAIGVARVGNSRDAFYFGPETPGAVVSGPFKDSTGAIARQAARFRIFGYDGEGRVVAELTAADADIAWRVAVANAKGAWYEADLAFDLEGAPAAGRRNPAVADRPSLVVAVPRRALDGAGAGPLPLDGGAFLGMPIKLGEAMTDREGRLVVLAGAGGAYSAPGAPPLAGFANNAGWTDDTCDGPIHATVRIGDRVIEADPGWLICTPPNYAPAVASSIVSTFDAIESALVEAGVRSAPAETVYERDVLPIFRRLNDFQWVNEGFFVAYGFGATHEWTAEDWRARLADRSEENAAVRQAIFATFRNPDFREVTPDAEPQLYGDKAELPPDAIEPRQWLSLTPLQYRHLAAWAEGRFILAGAEPPVRLEDYSLQDRPMALDRAALDSCIGGAFHPGIECPWIIRTAWIWTPEMRLARTSETIDRTDYGDTLTAPIAVARSGPLSRLGPGSITQWMGVPWHADASSCRFGYERAVSSILPGFWPARIPNGVLAEADYSIVMDTARAIDQRRAAFGRRRDWGRFISAPTRPPILAAMARDWFRLGMVEDRPGPADGAFPAVVKVETGVGFDREPDELYPAAAVFPQLGAFPLVVSNSDDNSLRLVDAGARVTVMPLSAPLERPEGITRGLDGNIYVCCLGGDLVRKVTPSGEVTLFADRPFKSPVSITQDSSGTFYVANYDKQGMVTAITREGETRVLVPPEAGLVSPVGVVCTPDGALLVSWGGGSVARVDKETGRVLNPHWITGLNNPRQMAFDQSYRLYLADQLNNAVRRYDLLGTPIPLTLLGAGLEKPFGLAFDAHGFLYATLTGGSLVKRIRIDGDVAVASDFAAGMRNGGGIAFIG